MFSRRKYGGAHRFLSSMCVIAVLLMAFSHVARADESVSDVKSIPEAQKVSFASTETRQGEPDTTFASDTAQSHLRVLKALSWEPYHEQKPAQTALEAPPTTPTAVSPVTTSPPSPSPTAKRDDETSVATPPQSISTLPMQRLEAFDVTMTMGGLILPLDYQSQLVFEIITRDRIVVSINEVLGSHQIDDLQVMVSLSSFTGETLVFDVVITIRSIIQVHDLNRYIVSAFNDFMESFIYINTLKATGLAAFSNISTISITSGTIVASTKPTDESASHNKTSGYLIASIVAVVIAVAAGISLVACLVQYKAQKKKLEQRKRAKRQQQNATISSSFYTSLDCSNVNNFASEIEVGSCMELSSLGDPAASLGLAQDLPIHDDYQETHGVIVDCSNVEGDVNDEDNVSVLDGSVHSAPLPSRDDASLSRIDTRSISLPTTLNDIPILFTLQKIISMSRIPSLAKTVASSNLTSSDSNAESNSGERKRHQESNHDSSKTADDTCSSEEYFEA